MLAQIVHCIVASNLLAIAGDFSVMVPSLQIGTILEKELDEPQPHTRVGSCGECRCVVQWREPILVLHVDGVALLEDGRRALEVTVGDAEMKGCAPE